MLTLVSARLPAMITFIDLFFCLDVPDRVDEMLLGEVPLDSLSMVVLLLVLLVFMYLLLHLRLGKTYHHLPDLLLARQLLLQ